MVIPRPVRVEQHPGLGAATGREPDLELLPFGPPEGYWLDTTGPVPRIRAQDAAGVAYALTTLGQLPVVGGRLPAVAIEDRPRTPWRGVRLDLTRHEIPVETVLTVLDDLAALKLNRLHLRLPGSSSAGTDDYRRIDEHAAARHIVVVPGIDAATLPEADVEPVVRELADLTSGPWVHLGGPGGPGGSSVDSGLEAVVRAAVIADRAGKQPIVWHDAGPSPALPPGTIAQYRGPLTPGAAHAEPLLAITERDGWMIASPADVAELGGRAGMTLAETIEWDPAELVPGVGEDRLLGIEALLDPGAGDPLEAVRGTTRARLCALAELAWSPRGGHDLADFEARLGDSPQRAQSGRSAHASR